MTKVELINKLKDINVSEKPEVKWRDELVDITGGGCRWTNMVSGRSVYIAPQEVEVEVKRAGKVYKKTVKKKAKWRVYYYDARTGQALYHDSNTLEQARSFAQKQVDGINQVEAVLKEKQAYLDSLFHRSELK